METPVDTIVQGQGVPFVVRRTGDTSAPLFARVTVTEGRSFWRPRGGGRTTRDIGITLPRNVDAYQFNQDYSLEESSEDYVTTVRVQSRASYVRGAPREATVTARVDDGIPRVSVADAPTVTEGRTLKFPVRLDSPSDREIRVTYLLRGTAVAGEDYNGDIDIAPSDAPGGTLTFAPGDTFREIALETETDGAAEPEETVEVELAIGPDSGVAPGSSIRATGRIRRSDSPVVTVAAVSERIAEGDEAAFTLTRTGDRSAPLTVDAVLTDGTSPSPAATPVSVGFGAGAATATLRLDTRDDAVVEADATILLVLVDGTQHDIGDPSRASVTVRDGARRLEVSIADAAPVTEGGTLVFPLRLSAPGAGAVTVSYNLAGTASAGADHAGGASGTVTFASGTTERTIRVATLDDDVDEPEESVRVSVVTVAAADSVGFVRPAGKTAAGRILDNDLPSVTVAPVADAVAEGADAAFVLTRAGDLSLPLAVSFAIVGADGVLASAAPAGATFRADAATARIALATVDGTADEEDATLTLTLQPDAGYDRGDPFAASVTVLDDDPWYVTVVADATEVTEGADATFTLTRTGDLSVPQDVPFAVGGGAGVLASTAPGRRDLRGRFGHGAHRPGDRGRRGGRGGCRAHADPATGCGSWPGRPASGHGHRAGRRSSDRDGCGGRGHGDGRGGCDLHADAGRGSVGAAGGVGCGDGFRFGAACRDLPRRGRHGLAAPGDG